MENTKDPKQACHPRGGLVGKGWDLCLRQERKPDIWKQILRESLGDF